LELSFFKLNVLLTNLEFSRLESWSRDPFLQVLVSVLVLEPSSLGLGLGLGTPESWSWSWNSQVSVSVLVLGLVTMKTRFCPPATSAPVERIFSHSEWFADAGKRG